MLIMTTERVCRQANAASNYCEKSARYLSDGTNAMHTFLQVSLTNQKLTSPRIVIASNVIEVPATVSPTDTLLSSSVARHYLSITDVVSVK